MQFSMTLLLPKGRSGFKAPMRFDWPAARTMAAILVNVFGVRWQAQRDTALDSFVAGDYLDKSKAPSPLRSAGALQRGPYSLRNSFSALIVYSLAICLRQFMTKSVLSSGRAFT